MLDESNTNSFSGGREYGGSGRESYLQGQGQGQGLGQGQGQGDFEYSEYGDMTDSFTSRR